MLGQCATLRWDVDNVRAVYYNNQGVAGHDSRRECPQTTTTYTLRAVTNSGDINRTITVNVQIPPPLLEFRADRTTIQRGECVTLNWAAAYVKTMSLDGATITSNPGSRQDCPTSTKTYTFRATTPSSGDLVRSVTVNVKEPLPAVDLQVDRSNIYRGECVVLIWAAADSQITTLDGNKVSNSGSQKDCPQATKTYTLRATNSSGENSRSVTVTILAGPAKPPPAQVNYNPYDVGQCTWWAWKRRTETDPIPIIAGNAGEWARTAEDVGLTVDQTPTVGSIVVWPPNTWIPSADGSSEQIAGDVGHVAYVEGVELYYERDMEGNLIPVGYKILISESNGGCDGAPNCKRYVWATTDAQFIH